VRLHHVYRPSTSPSLTFPTHTTNTGISCLHSVNMPACKFFLAGRCVRGDACPFSHSAYTASNTSALPDIANLTIRHRHHTDVPTSRGPQIPCRFFQNGSCRWGKACSFAHVAAPPTVGDVVNLGDETLPASVVPAPVLEDTRALLPCKYFLQGRCRNGADCPFFHSIDTESGAPAAASAEINVRPSMNQAFQTVTLTHDRTEKTMTTSPGSSLERLPCSKTVLGSPRSASLQISHRFV
jgi:hypothetical protein